MLFRLGSQPARQHKLNMGLRLQRNPTILYVTLSTTALIVEVKVHPTVLHSLDDTFYCRNTHQGGGLASKTVSPRFF